MTTMPLQLPDAYTLAADDIISLMIHSEEHCFHAELTLKLHYAWLPTAQHQSAYRAILELRKRGQQGTLHDTLVIDMAKEKFGGMVTPDWYNDMYAAGVDKYQRIDSLLADNFDASAEIVIRNGRTKALRRAVDKWANDLRAGKSAETVIQQMSDVAAFAGRTTKVENVHAGEHIQTIRQILNSKPRKGFDTGIPLVDMLTGGMSVPRFWQIAGAYKQRKTTLALNIILSILMQGGSVCFLSREMLREQVAFNFIAMLSVAWLKKNGHYGKEISVKATGEKIPVALISSDNLMRSGQDYQRWNDLSRDAVNAALDIYEGFGKRLRVYDITPEGGALSDMHSAEMILRRDKLLEGADLNVADYAGLFAAPGAGITEQYDYRARKFQEMLSLGTPLLVLLQRNEEAVKRSSSADEETHSPGTYGGGSFPAAADYLMLVRYEEKDGNRESDLTVTMKNTRHSSGGKMVYPMHSPSGLLLDANWIEKV